MPACFALCAFAYKLTSFQSWNCNTWLSQTKGHSQPIRRLRFEKVIESVCCMTTCCLAVLTSNDSPTIIPPSPIFHKHFVNSNNCCMSIAWVIHNATPRICNYCAQGQVSTQPSVTTEHILPCSLLLHLLCPLSSPANCRQSPRPFAVTTKHDSAQVY